jgi:Sulfite exporter TauE/SafE
MQDTAQIPEVIPYQYQFIVKPERSPVERRLAHFRVCMIVWGKCMIGRVVTPSGTETTLSHPSFAVAGGFAAATAYAAVITAAHLTSHGALPIMAVFVGATLGAIAGFAFVPLCAVPLLDLLGTPADVMLVLLVCSIANQTLTVAMLWRSIDWRRLAPILLTGAAGSPVGLLLLRHCNLHWYTLAFGAWLILYCLVTMFRPQVVTEQTDWTGDLVAGFLGGVCGGFLATPIRSDIDSDRPERPGQDCPTRHLPAIHPCHTNCDADADRRPRLRQSLARLRRSAGPDLPSRITARYLLRPKAVPPSY